MAGSYFYLPLFCCFLILNVITIETLFLRLLFHFAVFYTNHVTTEDDQVQIKICKVLTQIPNWLQVPE